MATRPGDIQANVGVAMNAQGMEGSLAALQRQIDTIITKLNQAGKAGENAVSRATQGGAAAIQQLNNQIRTLSQLQNSQRTIGRANANLMFGDMTDARRIGQMAEGFARLERFMSAGSSAAERLQARIAGIQGIAGEMIQRGQALPSNFWDKRFQLQAALDTHNKIEGSYRQMMNRINQLSPSGQQGLNPLLTRYNELSNRFTQQAGDNRTGPQLMVTLRHMQDITRELEKQIGLTRTQDQAYQQLLRSTQARAAALFNQTAAEREAQLRSGANAALLQLNNRGGGRFNDILGAPQPTVRGNPIDRLTQSTATLVRLQQQYNAAVANNAGADRLQTLINRYETLVRYQSQSLAMAEKERAQQGGFFGGMREGFGSVTRSPLGGEGGLAGFGNIVGRVAAFTAAYQAINLVTGALSSGAQFAVQFEDALAQLQAISGATSTEMARLSSNILEVARNSHRSVIELTQAATVIAQAGYSAAETTQLLQTTSQLAAATGSTMAEASDILTSSLGAFGLQTQENARVSDTLVSVLNESKLAVETVRLGIQYMGATARQSNVDINTMTAALGTMADAGVRGSTAATGMRQMFIDLQSPSDDLKAHLRDIGLNVSDIDIRTRGLIPVLQSLRENGFDAMSVLETRAAAAYNVLSANIPEIERLLELSYQQGSAHEAEAVRMDTLAAKWQQFVNTLATFANDLGVVVIPVLKQLLEALSTVIEGVNTLTNAFLYVINPFNSLSMEMLFGITTLGDYSDEVERTRTELNEAEAQSASTKDTLEALNQEVTAVTTRFADLSESESATALETERLSQRFPELRSQITESITTVEQLVQALWNLEDTQRQVLVGNLESQLTSTSSALEAERQNERVLRDRLQSGNGSLPSLIALNPSAAHRQFHTRAVEATRLLMSENQGEYDRGQALARQIWGDTNLPENLRNGFRERVTAYTNSRRNRITLERSATDLQRNITQARVNASPEVSGDRRRVVESASQLNRLTSQAEGRPIGERRTILNGAVEQGRIIISQAERFAAHLRELANNATDPGQRESLTARALSYDELAVRQRTALRAAETALRATTEETRAGQRAANEAERNREAARRNTGPRSTDVAAALSSQYGFRVVQTLRSAREQRLFNSQGRGRSDGAVETAPHVQGRGMDLGVENDTPENRQRIIETITRMGGTNVRFDNHPIGNGRRSFHVEWNMGNSEQAREAQEDYMAELRELEQARNDFYRDHIRILKEQADAEKSQLDEAQRVLDEETAPENMNQALSNVLTSWVEFRDATLEVARAEAERDMLSPEETQRYLDAAGTQLDNEYRSQLSEAAQNITQGVSDFISRRTREAEVFLREQTSGETYALRMYEATQTGLSDPWNAGRVPDYVRTVSQYGTERRQLDLLRAQQTAGATNLETARADMERLEGLQRQLGERTEANARLWDSFNLKISEARQRLEDLNLEQDALNQRLNVMDQVPTSWNDSIETAVRAWRIANNEGIGLGQRLRNELGGALNSIHQGFQGLFRDILSGTVSIEDAFSNMAASILDSMAEMAAQAIATEIFGMLLSFLPGGTGAKAPGQVFSTGMKIYRGGLVESANRPAKRFARGGLVSGGIPTRDTVPALLSKGEGVLQRSAVESIGHRMLMDINNRGAAALDTMSKKTRPIIMPNGKPVNTNVYVVLPEEQPTLGPDDVLAVVQRDVLRNGMTKHLIKSVARGG